MDKQQLHVLLVADDERDHIITGQVLAGIEGYGFTLEWVADCEIALEKMARNQYDVYLIEHRLDKGNGLKLLPEAIERGCTGPLILLTDEENHAATSEAIKIGAADYLVKEQMNAQLLARSIRYAIDRKRAEEAGSTWI